MSGMQRPILFFDLAGTLEVRDPVTGRWGLWPGADRALADLFDDFELHLTTGEGPGGAAGSLQDLDVREFFTGATVISVIVQHFDSRFFQILI